MLFFKDKKLVQMENVLNNPKASLTEKMEALSEYIPYLREKKDTKKEGDVFMGIVKAFKDKNNSKIYVGKNLLFLNDKKNNRIMLNAEFLKVMSVFTQTQMMVFASSMETLENFLDFFVTEKGSVLRFDFKNIVPMASIDMELFNKRSNQEANTQIRRFLSQKNIFISDDLYVQDAEELDAKFFHEMIPYMGEKTYPVLYIEDCHEVVDYMDVRSIERWITDNSMYMAWGNFLEVSQDVDIKLDGKVCRIPYNLLNRNSNFYITEIKRGLF